MAIFTKDAPPPVAGKNAPGRPETRSDRMSFLGANLVFDGTLTGNESVTIEGSVKGRIDLKSDLRIAAPGRVEATVHAANVLIEGSLVGDLSADKRVELLPSAKVEGNISAPKIVVAEGAQFRGSVDMGSKKPEGETKG